MTARRKRLRDRTKDWARTLKRDVIALWLAARDRRVPVFAKLISGLVAAYALSPVDLIPDFIPVIGYLDDIILVPLGILLAIRLIPPDIMTELRSEAQQRAERPTSVMALAVIVSIWVMAGAAFLSMLPVVVRAFRA